MPVRQCVPTSIVIPLSAPAFLPWLRSYNLRSSGSKGFGFLPDSMINAGAGEVCQVRGTIS